MIQVVIDDDDNMLWLFLSLFFVRCVVVVSSKGVGLRCGV